MRSQVEFKQAEYFVPVFQLGGAALTNQPANDGVEILSASASDVNLITVIGTDYTTGKLTFETKRMTGATPISLAKTDWGTIYGFFLGDIFGKNSTVAVGTITVREASADQAIGTLTAGDRSHGNIFFDIPGKNITFHNISGNSWIGVDDQLNYASVNDAFKYTAGMADDYKNKRYLMLLGDSTGSTAQIRVNFD